MSNIRKGSIKAGSFKVIALGEPDSFKGSEGETVAKRDIVVELLGPITVTAYGSSADLLKKLKVVEGDELNYSLKKSPSVGLS